MIEPIKRIFKLSYDRNKELQILSKHISEFNIDKDTKYKILNRYLGNNNKVKVFDKKHITSPQDRKKYSEFLREFQALLDKQDNFYTDDTENVQCLYICFGNNEINITSILGDIYEDNFQLGSDE